MIFRNGILGITLALAAAVTALAHTGATGIVKERMDAMGVMGKVVKSLAPIMRGDVPYDADAVRRGAEEIRAHAGEQMTRLFPKDSGGMPSEAKDVIWQEWQEFQNLAEQLQVLSKALALAANNGLMSGQDSGGSHMGTAAMMGADTLMGTGTVIGNAPAGAMGGEKLAGMPADNVFDMLNQTCSACHTKFRVKSN